MLLSNRKNQAFPVHEINLGLWPAVEEFLAENKNYVLRRNYDKKIKLNYSILNKIKLLGYKTSFIKTDKFYKKLTEGRENLEIDKNIITKKIIENIIDERIGKLKKFILNLKIIF